MIRVRAEVERNTRNVAVLVKRQNMIWRNYV